jgi:hypothetical protein
MSADIFHKESKNREVRKQLLRNQLNNLKMEIKKIELKCNKDLNQPSSSTSVSKASDKTRMIPSGVKDAISRGKTHVPSSLSSNIQHHVSNVNKASISTIRKQPLPGKIGLIAQMEAMRKQNR